MPRPGLISAGLRVGFASGVLLADTCAVSLPVSNSRPTAGLRPVLGGVSLLLAVALLAQASAACTHAAALRAGGHGAEVLRLAAIRPVQHLVQSFRRQVHKPVRVVLSPDRSDARAAVILSPTSRQVEAIRRPFAWQTSLPPPALA